MASGSPSSAGRSPAPANVRRPRNPGARRPPGPRTSGPRETRARRHDRSGRAAAAERGDRIERSPGIPSGSRLVVSTRSPGHAPSSRPTIAATSPRDARSCPGSAGAASRGAAITPVTGSRTGPTAARQVRPRAGPVVPARPGSRAAPRRLGEPRAPRSRSPPPYRRRAPVQRHPGLARAAGADHGDKAFLGQQRADAAQLRVTADEAGEGHAKGGPRGSEAVPVVRGVHAETRGRWSQVEHREPFAVAVSARIPAQHRQMHVGQLRARVDPQRLGQRCPTVRTSPAPPPAAPRRTAPASAVPAAAHARGGRRQASSPATARGAPRVELGLQAVLGGRDPQRLPSRRPPRRTARHPRRRARARATASALPQERGGTRGIPRRQRPRPPASRRNGTRQRIRGRSPADSPPGGIRYGRGSTCRSRDTSDCSAFAPRPAHPPPTGRRSATRR